MKKNERSYPGWIDRTDDCYISISFEIICDHKYCDNFLKVEDLDYIPSSPEEVLSGDWVEDDGKFFCCQDHCIEEDEGVYVNRDDNEI